MPLHFVSDDATAAGPGDVITLSGPEAHHAAAVRRVRSGEAVTVGDGRGTRLDARVERAEAREVTLRVDARTEVPAPAPRLVLVQALAKGDRDELAVQAATELGVDEIVPWQAARSISRWDAAKSAKGVARWSTIVREAAKQAHRAWVPTVTAPVGTADLAARAGTSRMLVLDPTAETALSDTALSDGPPDDGPPDDDLLDVVLVVGPEGGIAPEELVALEAAGGTRVRLGETVLRTSTAGPAALAVVSVALGRW